MKTTFKDIGQFDNFKFLPSEDGFFRDPATYRKMSARTYQAIDKTGGLMGPMHRIGSIKAQCEKVNP